MSIISRIAMAGAALAVAGCSSLPGANLGGTFSAERYLGASLDGGDFNSALAREYQALAVRSARTDVNWMDSTAYIAKSQAAAAGGVGPWSPSDLGVSADGMDEAVSIITANASARPAACAKAQAMWDQYLESLAEGAFACISAEDAKSMLDEALAACRGASGDLAVFFGFNQSQLSSAAMSVIDNVVESLKGVANPLISIVGHTDTVGSVAYNQRLSERRANSVEAAILARAAEMGVAIAGDDKSGRSENDLAVETGNNVREPRNRRATIAISN
ncbi:MAG: OmpA family protein [Pseudomonadota bacterium]